MKGRMRGAAVSSASWAGICPIGRQWSLGELEWSVKPGHGVVEREQRDAHTPPFPFLVRNDGTVEFVHFLGFGRGHGARVHKYFVLVRSPAVQRGIRLRGR